MGILKFIASLAGVIADLIAADGDAAKEDEAIMRAAEMSKAELDRRKFGNGGG